MKNRGDFISEIKKEEEKEEEKRNFINSCFTINNIHIMNENNKNINFYWEVSYLNNNDENKNNILKIPNDLRIECFILFIPFFFETKKDFFDNKSLKAPSSNDIENLSYIEYYNINQCDHFKDKKNFVFQKKINKNTIGYGYYKIFFGIKNINDDIKNIVYDSKFYTALDEPIIFIKKNVENPTMVKIKRLTKDSVIISLKINNFNNNKNNNIIKNDYLEINKNENDYFFIIEIEIYNEETKEWKKFSKKPLYFIIDKEPFKKNKYVHRIIKGFSIINKTRLSVKLADNGILKNFTSDVVDIKNDDFNYEENDDNNNNNNNDFIIENYFLKYGIIIYSETSKKIYSNSINNDDLYINLDNKKNEINCLLCNKFISLNDYNNGNISISNGCQHLYHKKCLHNIFLKNKNRKKKCIKCNRKMSLCIDIPKPDLNNNFNKYIYEKKLSPLTSSPNSSISLSSDSSLSLTSKKRKLCEL